MDDYPKTRSDRYWFIIIATVVLFYVTPTVCASIYTLVSPRTAIFGNKGLISYDSYVTDLLRDLSERDYAQHTDYGDEKRLRELYAAYERDFLTAASNEAKHNLLGYGFVALFAIGAIIINVRSLHLDTLAARRPQNVRRGIVIKPKGEQ